MTQHYSDPEREDETYTLPDLEVWLDTIYEITCCCGVTEVPGQPENPITCPSCERQAESGKSTGRTGYFYWFCLPGCLPDSDAYGPFDSEEVALEQAREHARTYDEV